MGINRNKRGARHDERRAMKEATGQWLAGTVLGMPAHEGRPAAIGEVHARPHPLIEAPRAARPIGVHDRRRLGRRPGGARRTRRARLGIAAPDRLARHHAMKWGKGALSWERHTEFSTYLWDCPGRCPQRQAAGRLAFRQWLQPARRGDLRREARHPQMDVRRVRS